MKIDIKKVDTYLNMDLQITSGRKKDINSNK